MSRSSSNIVLSKKHCEEHLWQMETESCGKCLHLKLATVNIFHSVQIVSPTDCHRWSNKATNYFSFFHCFASFLKKLNLGAALSISCAASSVKIGCPPHQF